MELNHPTRISLFYYVKLVAALFFTILNFQSLQANASAGNETDRLALLKFKQRISDPYGVLSSWNDSVPFCNWYGVTCSRLHQRVASLVLTGYKLTGSLPPEIGNLSFLKVLDLENNSLSGQIPPEVGKLFRLQQLLLHNNTSLEGEIPANLSSCSKVKIINLQYNNLAGKIPAELGGGLPELEILALAANNLTGEIPVSLGNLTKLVFFSVLYNNLVGNIPDELSRLTSLEVFSVAVNHLSGTISPSLLNISSIKRFSFAINQFHGTLPDNMGIALPNLEDFGIGQNDFSGSIPESLSNASQLQILDVGVNSLTGQVPSTLGNLKSLWLLDVSNNYLGINSTHSWFFLTPLKNCTSLSVLDLGYNSFGGALPISIGNLSIQLSQLYLGGNQISGTVPIELQNLINLITLSMENNFLEGTIPPFFQNFQKLQELWLAGNRLSGQIPSSIGNLTQLFKLILPRNKLEGSIPTSISNCKNLQYFKISYNLLNGTIPDELLGLSSLVFLNISKNSFSGNLSMEIGKLTNLNTLDVSGNKLSGEIPNQLSDCLSLEYLYMQGNSFQGSIPSGFSSLRGLQKLDLSRNNFTGEIPLDLQNIPFVYLNLSFNDLEGEVPAKGAFRNPRKFSLVGNHKLCGGVPELHLPKCRTKVMKQRKAHVLKLALIITCVMMFVILLLVFLFALRRKKIKRITSAASLLREGPVKVSYQDLHRATNGFSSDSLIGSGGFGVVYKGFLKRPERLVAIKVLKLEEKGASKSFMAECKVLKHVRHRNLVKLVTYCSSLDNKNNEFKALIYEFMENGNLEKWLHHANDDNNNQTVSLNFVQRLNIIIDMASAMYYLHDLCESPIIHCDLKPSNILLDDSMVAHVSDFGLSRLFQTANGDVFQSQTSSTGMKGTIGYAPPEYGMGGVASKEGDAYSFGIIMLELFSRRRPTDKMFKNGLNLHEFVKNALPERLAQIVDPTLFRGETKAGVITNSEEINNTECLSRMRSSEEECLIEVFTVGIACSKQLPKDRMNMGDVAKELHLIRSTLLGVRIYE